MRRSTREKNSRGSDQLITVFRQKRRGTGRGSQTPKKEDGKSQPGSIRAVSPRPNQILGERRPKKGRREKESSRGGEPSRKNGGYFLSDLVSVQKITEYNSPKKARGRVLWQ